LSGIYIHIPFCKQACHYCNFHFSTTLSQKDELVAALCRETALTETNGIEKIESIYFGGGTPSLLNEKELQLIFSSLNKKFSIAPDAEITLEANPDDIDAAKLLQWKKNGINRLSVGIQSFADEELAWMNRVHNAAASLRCINEIQAAGFTNFSIDLIYGSPLLSDKIWEENVAIVTENNIPHISCYALTVEPATALQKMIAQNKKMPVDAEKQAEQFLLLMKWMKATGYEHYEISNFAKPGMRSRHNSSYWQGKSYYGIGPSAHSFDGYRRKWNVANNTLYIQSIKKGVIPFEEEILTPTQQLNEYIMTSLRTIEGLNTSIISERFGEAKSTQLVKAVKKWEVTNKIEIINGHLILTAEGKLFADGIAAGLFF
jgi:oxygen-independent coproporphyrinogen III oxidase